MATTTRARVSVKSIIGDVDLEVSVERTPDQPTSPIIELKGRAVARAYEAGKLTVINPTVPMPETVQ